MLFGDERRFYLCQRNDPEFVIYYGYIFSIVSIMRIRFSYIIEGILQNDKRHVEYNTNKM